MDSTGKAKRRQPGDTEAMDQVRRMANIMAKVGCPHGRLYPEAEECRPCNEYEDSIMDPAFD